MAITGARPTPRSPAGATACSWRACTGSPPEWHREPAAPRMLPMATTSKALWLVVLLVAVAGCQSKDRAALGREARKAEGDLEHGVRKVGSLLDNLGHDIR